MTIRDLFNDWEGPGALVAGVLTLRGNAVPPNEAWFLGIVKATAEERRALQEAGYWLKDA